MAEDASSEQKARAVRLHGVLTRGARDEPSTSHARDPLRATSSAKCVFAHLGLNHEEDNHERRLHLAGIPTALAAWRRQR